ncbi:unnamed protein product [Rhizophagus irregularis]|nr:unnamed protein product [Rhizophagus irregularis]
MIRIQKKLKNLGAGASLCIRFFWHWTPLGFGIGKLSFLDHGTIGSVSSIFGSASFVLFSSSDMQYNQGSFWLHFSFGRYHFFFFCRNCRSDVGFLDFFG